MKACPATLALLLLAATAAPAGEVITAGPFAVDVGPALNVRCGDKTIFSGDRCVCLRGGLLDMPALVDTNTGEVVRQADAFTLLTATGRNRLRREVAVTPAAVEITYELQVSGETGGTHVVYDLLAPIETFDGQSCPAVIGPPRSQRPSSQMAFDRRAVKPGTYIVQELVYLTAPAAACTIDFNPLGAWIGEGNYGDAYAFNAWHDDNAFHFAAFCSGARQGAICSGKIVVRAGTPPYDDLHDHLPVDYTTEFPTVLALNFSEQDGDARYVACGARIPPERACRWRTPAAIHVVTRPRGGLLYRDFAAPDHQGRDFGGEAVLELERRSGLYLLTLNVCDTEEAVGPFSVFGPDGPLVEDVRVEPGRHWIKSVPLRFREGKAFLRFEGEWKVNALSLQTMLYEAEDFYLQRGFWNMEAPAAEARR